MNAFPLSQWRILKAENCLNLLLVLKGKDVSWEANKIRQLRVDDGLAQTAHGEKTAESRYFWKVKPVSFVGCGV